MNFLCSYVCCVLFSDAITCYIHFAPSKPIWSALECHTFVFPFGGMDSIPKHDITESIGCGFIYKCNFTKNLKQPQSAHFIQLNSINIDSIFKTTFNISLLKVMLISVNASQMFESLISKLNIKMKLKQKSDYFHLIYIDFDFEPF